MSTIGPGSGGLMAGLARANIRNAQGDVTDLANQLAKTRELLTRAVATADARQAVTNEIVRELAAAEDGKLTTRRLSDPKNKAARVQFREDAEEDHLNRLSGGKLTLKRETKRGSRP